MEINNLIKNNKIKNWLMLFNYTAWHGLMVKHLKYIIVPYALQVSL